MKQTDLTGHRHPHANRVIAAVQRALPRLQKLALEAHRQRVPVGPQHDPLAAAPPNQYRPYPSSPMGPLKSSSRPRRGPERPARRNGRSPRHDGSDPPPEVVLAGLRMAGTLTETPDSEPAPPPRAVPSAPGHWPTAEGSHPPHSQTQHGRHRSRAGPRTRWTRRLVRDLGRIGPGHRLGLRQPDQIAHLLVADAGQSRDVADMLTTPAHRRQRSPGMPALRIAARAGLLLECRDLFVEPVVDPSARDIDAKNFVRSSTFSLVRRASSAFAARADSRAALRAAFALVVVAMRVTLNPPPAYAAPPKHSTSTTFTATTNITASLVPRLVAGRPPTPVMSRPAEDCKGCPPLAGARNLGLDDPRAVRPDSHCNFGDRSIRACRATAATQRKSASGPYGRHGTVRHPRPGQAKSR